MKAQVTNIPLEWFTNTSLKESFEEFKVQYPTATLQSYLEWVYAMSIMLENVETTELEEV